LSGELRSDLDFRLDNKIASQRCASNLSRANLKGASRLRIGKGQEYPMTALHSSIISQRQRLGNRRFKLAIARRTHALRL
jgi:hypothetical protein